jgi:NAD(P)H-hydrate epimerase
MEVVSRSLLKCVYKKRPDWARKHDFGNLLVVGGSKLYPTTPVLVALAAYRAGVDWVTVAAPQEAARIIATHSPNIMTYPLEGEFLEIRHVSKLLELLNKRTAVEIGGGLTRGEHVLSAIIEFLKEVKVPCVIDDDALYAVAKNKEVIKENFVLTPHSFEFYVLSGKKVSTDLKKRVETVRKVAAELGATIVLKGHVDVISNGKEVAVNKTGTPLMTKAGFGNTLAGICAAILARKVDTFTAACVAAYINGKAGELAAKLYGEGMLPSDLIEHISHVIKV